MAHSDCSKLEAEIYAENELNKRGVTAPKNLGRASLIAGFLQEINFIELVDSRCPKTSQHHVTNGQVSAIMVTLIGSGMYRSLSAASRVIKEHSEILAMFGLKPSDVAYISRDIMGETLAYVWGSEALGTLYKEAALRGVALLGLGDLFKQFVIDGTNNPSWNTQSADGANDRIRIFPGTSKTHRHDLNQYNTYGICSPEIGSLLSGAVKDGNAGDNSAFGDLIAEGLPVMTECFNSAHYVSVDPKLFSPISLALIRTYDLHAVTCAPDILSSVKQALASTEDLVPIYSAEEVAHDRRRNKPTPLGKWILLPDIVVPPQKLDDDITLQNEMRIPLKGLLVKNYDLEATKKRTLTKKAKKEQELLTKELKHKFLCGSDAQAAVSAAQSKAKYCIVKEVCYHVKFKNKRRGKPSQDDSKNERKIASVVAEVDIRIDEERLAKMVEQECVYVIVTTDVERDWTMRELFELYHNNSAIERYWRTSNTKTFLVPKFFLENDDRIEALVWLRHIAVLAYCIMEYKLRKAS